MRVPPAATVFVAVGLALAAACGSSPSSPIHPTPPTSDTPVTPPPTAPPTTPPAGTPPPTGGPPPNPTFTPTGQAATVVAVGDIGECGSVGVQQAARLAERIDGQVILAGDLAYMQGSMSDYLRCFDPFWGQFRRRWRPAPGNHEYETPGAAGYFQYFGEAAGPGYYAFRTGDWLVLMINSNPQAGVGRGSAQYEFVRSQLQTNRNTCVMAVWHHPLFTSGPNGANVSMRDLWGLLYENGADVVVAGHDHLYERFGKQDVDGRSDPRGLRQFIVGTGGARLYDFMRMAANSQARLKAHGVLRLTLQSTSYDWAFMDANGGIGDVGSDSCH